MDLESAKKHGTLELIDEGVYLLTLTTKVYSTDSFRALNYYLDVLDKTEGPQCLISIGSDPKTFSAGFHFSTFDGHNEDITNRLQESGRFLARFLALGYPTICAISGNCYGAGYMFAMAHDFRYMRDDFGVIC